MQVYAHQRLTLPQMLECSSGGTATLKRKKKKIEAHST
jgi:hypothetical protein